MSDLSIRVSDVELQRRLIERAEALRRYVDKRIPKRFSALVTAEDVLQDIWVSAFRTAANLHLDVPGEFDRWLQVLVRRRLADALRTAGAVKRGGSDTVFRGSTNREASFADLFSMLASDEKTPSREMSMREAALAVRVALSSLPEPRRRVILMRHIEGRSREEIAREMQKSDAAVNSMLYQGMLELRGLLGEARQYFSDAKSSPEQPLNAGPSDAERHEV